MSTTGPTRNILPVKRSREEMSSDSDDDDNEIIQLKAHIAFLEEIDNKRKLMNIQTLSEIADLEESLARWEKMYNGLQALYDVQSIILNCIIIILLGLVAVWTSTR